MTPINNDNNSTKHFIDQWLAPPFDQETIDEVKENPEILIKKWYDYILYYNNK